MKILVVDNHPVMLKLMKGLLEKEGHEVQTAINGLTALSLLQTHTPDIIFTDLIMPRIDGKKLCEIIRKTPHLQNICIVILSAIAAEDEEKFFEYGANACVAKGPFNRMSKHILQILRRLEQETISMDQVIGLDTVFPHQITKELLSIKKQFDTTLKGMIEGFLEVTPEGDMIYANPAAISIIGQPEEQLLASNFLDLFRQDQRKRVEVVLQCDGGPPKSIPIDFPVKLNGKEVSVQVLPITGGDHRSLILILNDVTERKKMESKLIQAQKMEALGTLAGGIAHDFNNLLMVVQGNVSLILVDMNPSHPHYEMLKSIEKKAQNGSRLTSQLLGYARKGRYEVRPMLLNQLVEETAGAFGRTRKDIVIHMDLYRDLYPLEADSGQIEQVLMNLLVNAADAMPDGGTLFLNTRNVTHQEIESDLYEPVPGDYVLLSVTDTGIGMDQQTMTRIFDPFFTTKELGRGTGLGLASAYGIIKGHNGYINVRSEVGKGATFLLYLPASKGEVEEQAEKSEDILKGSETVLLVDDEEQVLEVGEKILKSLGYEVLTVDSGENGVELYKTNRDQIGLVILDLIMPHKGGRETFDALREIHPEVKVLLSSGYSMNEQTMEIIKRGCKGFIQKPFSIMELSQKLREVLGNPKP